MKIVNINEYNEGDGLRNKLRQRIDKYEPELSGSLWDRINHEMDQRENNRKKRFLWWFSSVAVVVLASGILTFLMVNDRQNPAIVQQPAATPQVETPAPLNEGMATAPGTTDAPANTNAGQNTVNTNAPRNPGSAGKGSQDFAGGENGNTSPVNGAGGNTANSTTENNTNGTATAEQGNTTATLGEDNGNGGNGAKEEAINKGKEETPAQTQQPEAGAEGKPDDDNKTGNKTGETGNNEPKAPVARWFVGLGLGVNQTYRTVTDIQKVFSYNTADDRNRFEKPGYNASFGIDFGYYITKGLFIKSGFGMYNTSEKVKYDITKRRIVQQGVVEDSLIAGSGHIRTNTYSYVQIPLELGYRFEINKTVGMFVSGGVAYNMLTKFSYNYYQTVYDDGFTHVTDENNNYFTSYYMAGINLGATYNIGKNWMATGGLAYKRAITTASSKDSYVDVRPYSTGFSLGIMRKF